MGTPGPALIDNAVGLLHRRLRSRLTKAVISCSQSSNVVHLLTESIILYVNITHHGRFNELFIGISPNSCYFCLVSGHVTFLGRGVLLRLTEKPTTFIPSLQRTVIPTCLWFSFNFNLRLANYGELSRGNFVSTKHCVETPYRIGRFGGVNHFTA